MYRDWYKTVSLETNNFVTKKLLKNTNIDTFKHLNINILIILIMKKLLPIVTFIYIFALTGCGQTGALYLPESSIATSGSTLIESGLSLASGSTQKIDNDPSKPDRSSDPHANELVDSGDNFGFDQNIQDSSNAGGTPS
jgi:predicted small lipoprotein YifL